LARGGVAVLMISSELPEVLRISDRILVMREGRLMTELAHAEASEEEILSAATGQATAGGTAPGQAEGGRGAPRWSRRAHARRRPGVPARANSPSAPSGSGNRASSSSWCCSSP